MTNSPTIDDKERETIRWRLQQYQRRHGDMGVPKLYQHMQYYLRESNIDLFHLDLRSLQRFIRNEVRTADEKVVRYRKFLQIVFPKSDGFSENFVALLREKMIFPVSIGFGAETVPFDTHYWPKPLIDYQGVYDVDYAAYGNALPDPNRASDAKCLLLPGASEHALRVSRITRYDGKDREGSKEPEYLPDVSSIACMKCGRGQFLLASVGFENVEFTLLRDTTPEDAGFQTVLTGHCLHTVAPEAGHDGILSVRFTKTDGPEFPRD